MSPILRFDVEMEEFIQQLSDRLANRGQQRKQAKPVTDTKPFNLTRPRPRSVPTPERVSCKKRALSKVEVELSTAWLSI